MSLVYKKNASVHLALFLTTRYNSSNSATGNESTDMHMSSSSARAGFREATGIRRAPPRGETRRLRPDLAWSRLGLNWTEGAEGTEGPILRDRRSLIWAPENHNLRQEASRTVNYSTLSLFWGPCGAKTHRLDRGPSCWILGGYVRKISS